MGIISYFTISPGLFKARGFISSDIKTAALITLSATAPDCDATVISVYVSVNWVPFLTVPKVQVPIIQGRDLVVFLDSPEHTRTRDRDRFILILLFDSAVRVSELVGISLGDIVNNNGS